MNKISGSDRLKILRRNELWRQVVNNLTMLGAIALVASVGLPASGVGLTWSAVAILTATGAIMIGLAFVLLRFIDHSA